MYPEVPHRNEFSFTHDAFNVTVSSQAIGCLECNYGTRQMQSYGDCYRFFFGLFVVKRICVLQIDVFSKLHTFWSISFSFNFVLLLRIIRYLHTIWLYIFIFVLENNVQITKNRSPTTLHPLFRKYISSFSLTGFKTIYCWEGKPQW